MVDDEKACPQPQLYFTVRGSFVSAKGEKLPMGAFTLGILCSLLIVDTWGCGKAIFEPSCALPRWGDPYSPVAVTGYGDELLVLDADSAENFCGGSLRIFSSEGSPKEIVPLKTAQGYEAHFLDLVVRGAYAYTLGRRFGYLFKISLTPPYAVTAISLKTPYSRLFSGPGDLLIATYSSSSGSFLVFLDSNLNPISSPILLPEPVGAITMTSDGRGLWVGFSQGEEGVWKLDLASRLQVVRFAYPLGTRAITSVRALAQAGAYLFGLDELAGILFVLDNESGAALAIVPGLVQPIALTVLDGQVLILDRKGRLLRYRDQTLEVLLTGLATPVHLALVGSRLYIAEFTSGVSSRPWPLDSL